MHPFLLIALVWSAAHSAGAMDLTACSDKISGLIIGNGDIAKHNASSPSDCCALCSQSTDCVAYTYADDEKICFLKDNMAKNITRVGQVSGTISRPAYSCGSDMDCELLGRCVHGSCVCGPGFKGPSCGELDFAPASAKTGIVWPQQQAILDNSSMSWGFTVVYDEVEAVYHAVVNAGCCRSSTCGVYVDGTHLVHLTSRDPSKGFKAVAAVAPPTAFNPHLIRAPNGTYILYFRVNDLNNYTVCRGDGTSQDSATLKTYIPRNQLKPGGGEDPGANMYVAWAESMSGPWSVQKVDIFGMGRLHISNPSITFSSSNSQWKVMLAYRFNPAHGEQNGFAVADSFRGPFRSLANLTKAPHNDEDPFLWQDTRDHYHIVYHNGAHGYHAYSKNGIDWRKSPTKTHAFELLVDIDDGSQYSFARRERPEILFANGRPAFLYNGVNTYGAAIPRNQAGGKGFSRAFSLAQPFRTSSQTIQAFV